jgi:lysophospholipase L1-like esterase
MMSTTKGSPRARVLALLALIAIAAAACAPQHLAADTRVLLIGNSLLNGTRVPVTDALEAAGWVPLIKADGGTAMTSWTDQLPLLTAQYQPGVLVIELGTNDCSPVECVPLAPHIDAIMSSVPSDHPVLWMNVQEDVPSPYGDNTDYVNSALEAADARWPNLYLIDLDGLMEGHPEWHAADGLHFNDEGKEQFVRFIVDELERFKPV